MIKEITNSIKAVLYQRISSPIYGTYIATWLIYNWKITLPIFFGDQKFDDRFQAFKDALICQDHTFNWPTLYGPLIITVVLLSLLPIIQRYVYIYSEWNKSEGLKKRDEYSSETMLSLDESNELRASVKNIQQFNQDIIKNKDLEIGQYRTRSETLSNTIDELNQEITNLNEMLSQCESSKSDLSKEISEKESRISEAGIKYTRLSRIFSKQRLRSLIKNKKYNSLYLSKDVMKMLPSFVGIEDTAKLDADDIQIVKDVISISSSVEWIEMCHKTMIYRFSKCWSYDMADNYFDNLIKPYLKEFSKENLTELHMLMQNNSQINDRRRGKSDLDMVNSILNSKSV